MKPFSTEDLIARLTPTKALAARAAVDGGAHLVSQRMVRFEVNSGEPSALVLVAMIFGTTNLAAALLRESGWEFVGDSKLTASYWWTEIEALAPSKPN